MDGLSVGEIGQVVLRDRQLLSRDGMVIVVVTVDRKTGEVIAGPDIVTRGFVYARDAEALIEQTKDQIRAALTHEVNGNGNHPSEWSFLNKKIRDTVSDYLYTQTHRRPMVLPLVVEL